MGSDAAVIRRSAERDWYVVAAGTQQALAQLQGTPGIRFSKQERGKADELVAGQALLVHRSHLPLLNPYIGEAKDWPTAPKDIADLDDGRLAARGLKLRAHQKTGRQFIRSRAGSLIADQMRLGKTVEILASHDPDEGRLVVCAPLPVRHVWLKWMSQLWPDRRLVAVTGRTWDPDTVLGADLVFCHYDILPSWHSVAPRLKPSLLVFDEAHVLSSRKSNRSEAAAVMSVFADRVVCATGTPLWNKPDGFWGPLSACCPAAFGKYWDFAIRYASARRGAYGFETGDPSFTDELRARLAEVHLARTWNDVAEDLPETKREVVIVPVVHRDLDIAVESASQDAEADRTWVGQMVRYRGALASSKVGPSVDLALRRPDEPVVIWVWHKAVARAIDAELSKRCSRPRFLVHGDMVNAKREERIEAWQATSDGVLIITMAVGQAGIDLSHSKVAILGELDWTPAVIAQVEMRTFSPLRPMEIFFVTADHEVDLRLVEVIQAKCRTAREMGVAASEGAADLLGSMFPGSDPGDLDRLMQAVIG